MTEKEIKELLRKYLDGSITSAEEILLETFDSTLLNSYSQSISENTNHKEAARKHINAFINRKNRRSQYPDLLMFSRIAASIILVIGLGYLLYTNMYPTIRPEIKAKQLVQSTIWGQKKTIVLPDGSTVRLNSGSTLEFPDRFDDDCRSVRLEGEAFFEVTRNPEKPFVIKTGAVKTIVLGTTFNVNSFSGNSEIAVTVATGKVKVASPEMEVLLGPDEQGVFDRTTGSISRKSVESADFLYWKEGILHFEDVPLEQVAKSLERWYGVSIRFQHERTGKSHLTATYNDELLSVVLESMMYVKKGLSYEYTEDKKILIKGRCAD
ncbi:FecR family protein [Robertkochia solimangrovi]|uniref:FecR family protein n=1 Tax=Robertkochia solimangrovi TaxID=2213046 RepID=UPI0011814BBB|nr:FecR domain-containing protein [Robertkochia solimangrovi]TRZ44346.1 hypothetical protein DMZ48_07500 [Robertkochia solimangrovi]